MVRHHYKFIRRDIGLDFRRVSPFSCDDPAYLDWNHGSINHLAEQTPSDLNT
jgi:hypothetical protein